MRPFQPGFLWSLSEGINCLRLLVNELTDHTSTYVEMETASRRSLLRHLSRIWCGAHYSVVRESGLFSSDSLRHLENCIASTSVLDSYDSSYKGSLVNALALGADEGRGRLR